MTYGQIRLRLSQLFPGTSLEIIDGFIQDRYIDILDKLPWKRLEGETVVQVPPSVNTGTVSVAHGTQTVTGVGTTWTQATIEGLTMRINNAEEFYIPTFVDATHLLLDRNFEQPDVANVAYRIDQNIFLAPSNARIIRAIRTFHPPRSINGDRMMTPGELNRMAPGRTTYGIPRYASRTWDSSTTPPILQIELYPIPSSPSSTGQLLSFAIDYIYDAADIDPTQTSFTMLPWVRPSAIIAGVQADLASGAEAQRLEGKCTALVRQMSMINALQRGPQAIRLAPEYRGSRGGYPGYHIGKHADRDYFGEDDFDL